MSDAHAATAPRRRSDGEAGAVLVLFALLLVGVFGLLGAVVDGGRLRVTAQQLQAGAESAALEGVRFKDRADDAARRRRALTAVAWQWDDDLNAVNGDTLGLGAGSLPIVTGAAPLGGAIDVAVPRAARVFKPAAALQQNHGNAEHGDLVAGTHVPGAEPYENDAFRRDDFKPTAAGSTSSELADSPAFLVRLRRATARLPLDRQPGESSAGPPFEWLWARGSAWQEPTAPGGAQSRADGLTVRATSIASTEAALFVSQDPAGGVTLAQFALRGDSASAWHATAAGATLTLDLAADGTLTSGGVEQGLALASPATRVGDATVPASTPPAAVAAGELVVPAYVTVAGQRRVVGFTLATATLAGNTLLLTRLRSAVLPTGASSISPDALDARIALEQTPALAASHATLAEPVLAPVLRR